jgi:hypothetical protein
MHPILIALLVLFCSLVSVGGSACVNNCNMNGVCDTSGVCTCFDGYAGIDCSERKCPVGRRLSDIPRDFDTAHAYEECSGQGACIIGGVCKCDANFAGPACERLTCFNDCSQHGECLSLKQAAQTNDGFEYNRTTTYTQWDAGVIYGCKCDSGWSGFDCSERVCEYGVDPRLHDNQHETVILKVVCPVYGCKGSFKLRAFGTPINKWVTADTLNTVLQAQLMVAGRTYTDNAAHSSLPIVLEDQNGCNGCSLGNRDTTTYTHIKFLRQAGHVPAVSLYASLMTAGSVSFETEQIISCDCTNNFCRGTFRVAFDGVIGPGSSNINPHSDDGTLVVAALNSLETVTNAGLTATLSSGSGTAICVSGAVTNHTILIDGPLGNAPSIDIWSSVVATANASPTTFSSEDSDTSYSYPSTVLRVYSPQTGRDDSLKICSGIGTCNYETATCECPEGWETHADSGPCSVLSPSTSEYDGLQACPGLVWTDQPDVEVLQRDILKSQRMYVSVNHVTDTYFGPARSMLSSIEYFDWDPDTMIFNLGRSL